MNYRTNEQAEESRVCRFLVCLCYDWNQLESIPTWGPGLDIDN